MKAVRYISVAAFALVLTGAVSHAQGVMPSEEMPTVLAAETNSELDMMITGSTGSLLPDAAALGGSSLETICDQACQLERLDTWRDLIDE